jgi:glutamate N-acetyltransferase / amino-acid N-acetyltransferase
VLLVADILTPEQTRAAEILEHEDLEILVRLGTGDKQATYWTCDYSHEYM